MITPSEIKQKLNDGTMSGEDAIKFLIKSPKPWKTKEWKEKRKEILKDHCETCGDTDSILVIQHKYHPPTISQIIEDIRKDGYDEFEKTVTQRMRLMDEFDNLPKETDVCPKCGSEAIRFKKERNCYICVGSTIDYEGIKIKRTYCKNTFDKPAKSASWQDIYGLRRLHKDMLIKLFDVVFDTKRRAAIMSIEYHEEYMSMKDTKTLCKRCAFLEDINIIKN